MSRAGNVGDDSVMESFFSSLKTDRTVRKVYRTRDEAQANMLRLYRAILQPAPAAFETGLPQPIGVRGPRFASLVRRQRNRQQLIARIECNVSLQSSTSGRGMLHHVF